MRNITAISNKQSYTKIRGLNRNYLRSSGSGKLKQKKSSQLTMSHFIPYLLNKSPMNTSNHSSKAASRQSSLINIGVLGEAHSNDCMKKWSKNDSKVHLATKYEVKEKGKLISEGTCQSQGVERQKIQNEIEQLHYQMVSMQQKCKKMINN